MSISKAQKCHTVSMCNCLCECVRTCLYNNTISFISYYCLLWARDCDFLLEFHDNRTKSLLMLNILGNTLVPFLAFSSSIPTIRCLSSLPAMCVCVMGGTHKNFQLSSAFDHKHAHGLSIRECKVLIGPQ